MVKTRLTASRAPFIDLIWASEIVLAFSATVQMTPSEHGGVVREPKYRKYFLLPLVELSALISPKSLPALLSPLILSLIAYIYKKIKYMLLYSLNYNIYKFR